MHKYPHNTCAHTHAHTCIHTKQHHHIHACVYSSSNCQQSPICHCMDVYTQRQGERERRFFCYVYINTYIYMQNICLYIYMCVYVYIFTHIRMEQMQAFEPHSRNGGGRRYYIHVYEWDRLRSWGSRPSSKNIYVFLNTYGYTYMNGTSGDRLKTEVREPICIYIFVDMGWLPLVGSLTL